MTTGLVIDAGSGGSRLHIYTWKPRYFKTIPPSLSYPQGNEQWSAKISPGIATLNIDLTFDKIVAHLNPLLIYAKNLLIQYKDSYGDIPIYFYATGGMRELDSSTRNQIMDYVRKYLSNTNFSPFYFQDDFARTISGITPLCA